MKKRPQARWPAGKWVEVCRASGRWQLAASTGRWLVDGAQLCVLTDELDFVQADPLVDVRDYSTPNRFVSAEDDALFTLFDSILGASTDGPCRSKYQHIKPALGDDGQHNGLWEAIISVRSHPGPVCVGRHEQQFVAACVADSAIHQLVAAGMPGQHHTNFEDTLRAQGLAHLGHADAPPPTIPAEVLQHVQSATRVQGTYEPRAVLRPRALKPEAPRRKRTHVLISSAPGRAGAESASADSSANQQPQVAPDPLGGAVPV